MKLVLDGAQQMLAKSASDFMAKNDAIARLRALRDSDDELGYSQEVWSEMVDLGWPAIAVSEEDGGLGLGLAEVVLVTEALGRGLAPEPFLSSVFAASLLGQASVEQKARWLSPMVEGDKRVAAAYQEAGSRYDLASVGTSVEAVGGGWRLSGEKIQVIDGYGADAWIVSAGAVGGEGITLFVVPADRAGADATRQKRVDSRNAAIVSLNSVEVTEGDMLGSAGAGLALLEDAVDRVTVALCGEMLGGMSEAFDRTVAYLNEREQFGVLIGTFQALKHRAAKMFIERELVRSVVMGAARSVDDGAEDARVQVSNAKARCSDAYILLTNEALQMHGGIGMTDEHDIGLFMKRARVSEMTFGDAAFHRNRFAELQGY